MVVVRPTFDRWHAMVLLLDEGAATDVAAIVDRSPAWSVNGAAPDIAPLIPLLRRRRSVDVRPWVVTAYPVEITDVPDDSTRLAGGADLDALVELYSAFEFVGGLTAWQLRAMLRHVLDRHYIDRRGPAGRRRQVRRRSGDHGTDASLRRGRSAHRAPGPSRCRLVVGPRRRAQSIGNALGLAGIAALAGSNPLDLDVHLRDDQYVAVELVPRQRFRGQGRLRQLYGRWQPLRPRAPTWLREPGDQSAPEGS